MSQISANVDIFVGNDILIDPDIYQLWLNGYSGKSLASILTEFRCYASQLQVQRFAPSGLTAVNGNMQRLKN